MLIVGHRCPCSLNMLYMSYSFLCCCYLATVYSFTASFFQHHNAQLCRFGSRAMFFFFSCCCCWLVVANAASIVVYFVAVVIVFFFFSFFLSWFTILSLSLTLAKINFRLAFIYCNRFTCNCLCPVTWMGFPFRSTSILPHHFTNYALTHRTLGERERSIFSNGVFQCCSLS